jgi:hypothetical protein
VTAQIGVRGRTVSELGCRLDVASYPGRGTRLSVVFPALEGLN